jgi:hypothetical protein
LRFAICDLQSPLPEDRAPIFELRLSIALRGMFSRGVAPALFTPILSAKLGITRNKRHPTIKNQFAKNGSLTSA